MAALVCAGGCATSPATPSQLSLTADSPSSPAAAPAALTAKVEIAQAIPTVPTAPAEPPSSETIPPETIPPGEANPSDPATILDLAEVTDSVLATFPLLEIAQREREIAAGKVLSAEGGFDLNVDLFAINAPLGYYQTTRSGVLLTQPVYRGGYVYGGYKLGDGNFEPWYGNRETNEGGEFKVGVAFPLLRDRAIDKRRAALAQAQIAREAVEPGVQAAVLAVVQSASQAYWSWVAAGQAYRVQKQLLDTAITRNQAIKRRVELKDLPAIELTDNERLIASRQAKLIEAERKVQATAIKLSLFLRSEKGEPRIPSVDLAPVNFPALALPAPGSLQLDIDRALAARPELRDIQLQREQVLVELSQSQNALLPSLSATAFSAQDVGAPASSKKDKSPFQMEAGLLMDVPLQRREASGKIRAAEGKLAQLTAKRIFAENKITIEVQDAMSALTTSYDRMLRAKEAVDLADRMEAAERRKFELGDSTILIVNLREIAAIEAELNLIEARGDYFKAQADYHAAIAIDPFQNRGGE